MQSYILRILFERLNDRIRSLIRWYENIAIFFNNLLSLRLLYDIDIFSHVNVDLILISPLGSFKLINCHLSFFLGLIGWLSSLFSENICYLLICSVILLAVKEHLLFISTISFLFFEHLSCSLSFFSSQINHWPLLVVKLFILSENWS